MWSIALHLLEGEAAMWQLFAALRHTVQLQLHLALHDFVP